MIQFTKAGVGKLTLERGRVLPARRPVKINQIMSLTKGNNAKVADIGSALKLIELRLEGLSRDNYDGSVNGLLTWFENSGINWAQNTFTLTDEFGATKTVRLWQKDFDMVVNEGETFSVTLTLKVEG